MRYTDLIKGKKVYRVSDEKEFLIYGLASPLLSGDTTVVLFHELLSDSKVKDRTYQMEVHKFLRTFKDNISINTLYHVYKEAGFPIPEGYTLYHRLSDTKVKVFKEGSNNLFDGYIFTKTYDGWEWFKDGYYNANPWFTIYDSWKYRNQFKGITIGPVREYLEKI